MSGYRIGLVKVRDFLPFGKVEFDFSQPGLTVVEGEIVGVTGCDSNGSGKSALIEAPVWALTGRCIRERYKGDDVIRLGCSKTGARVEVNLVGGPRKIKVIRYRKDSKKGDKVILTIDGKNVSMGTNKQTDMRIEAELGLDFETFMSTVAFGARAEVRSFFFSTDSERKRIMDKLLGLEVFAKAQLLAKARTREITRELDDLMTEQLNLGLKVSSDESAVKALQEEVDVDPIELADTKILVRRLADRRERQQQEVQTYQTQLDDIEESFRDVLRAHDNAADAARKAEKRFQKSAEEMRREGHTANREAQRLRAECDAMKELEGAECPTCHQDVLPITAQEISASLLGEASDAEGLSTKAEADAIKIESEIEGIEWPEDPDRSTVDLAQTELDVAKRMQRDTSTQWRESKVKLAALEAAHARTAGQVDILLVEIEADNATLAKNLTKQQDIRDRASRAEFWSQAFGNGGLKSYVIEAEMPQINKLATSYAQQLLGTGAFVRLKATKALKTKDEEREEMVVEAGIPGCTESYAGASKGQRHRLDLAMILAFRDVVAHRSAAAFDQLFADELFDGVDATGIDCVTEILQEVAATCPVLLVTHDARLKSVGDRLVTVRHENGKASLATT